jgi:N-methylhydantoinase A
MVMGRARIAADIGGTFTDLVLQDGDRVVALKVASTPQAPERAVLEGVERLLHEAGLAPRDVAEVLHGTTVGSNTLLQRAGASCGLITTQGFRDILEIGRLRTPVMFDLRWDKPTPLVRRRDRLEIEERISAAGEILRPLDEQAVLRAGRALLDRGVEVIAVCFLNAHRNPAHEQRAAALLREAFAGTPVTASCEVSPESGEYERCSTTVVNAYVLPAMRGYLRNLREGLSARGVVGPLLVATSGGGLASAAFAETNPVYFISSGRSAGAVGAAKLGGLTGHQGLVVFDMGGTTASATLIEGGALHRIREYEFRDGISTSSRFIKAGGYLMRVPSIDVAEVGSGGGSIAAIDPGGMLTVGPLSAGAQPGPACYRRGGSRPTVTDANLVLGYLPERLADGTLELDRDAARASIERAVAVPLRLTVEDAALGIRAVANAHMTRAIRAVSVERGLDPRDLTLLAFGGSGPAHACDLAAILGMTKVVFPPGPGVFTASGMLASTPERDYVRSLPGLLTDIDPAGLDAVLGDLARMAETDLGAEGLSRENLRHDFAIDLRFRNQDIEVAVPIPLPVSRTIADDMREDFLARYCAIFRYASSDAVETSAVRLRTSAPDAVTLDFAALASSPRAASRASRQARFANGTRNVPVMDRGELTGGVAGPLILDGADSTILIPPGWSAVAGPLGTILAQQAVS